MNHRVLKHVSTFVFLIAAAFRSDAEPVAGPFAIERAQRANLQSTDPIEQKVIKTLAELGTGFLWENASEDLRQGRPVPPPDGTHPYEWDSLRSSEDMLRTCSGGSCGTYALSAAAMLLASGVSSDDVRIIGAVNATEFQEICPMAGRARRENPRNSANGHTVLLLRLSNGWYLLNTTHPPLLEPLRSESLAVQTFNALKSDCKRRFGQGSAERKQCLNEAIKEANKRLTLQDIEITPFVSPTDLEGKMTRGAVNLPIEKFPSLIRQMGALRDPKGMVIFQSWKFEAYPKHTFQDRFNIVASGDKSHGICRWGAREINL